MVSMEILLAKDLYSKEAILKTIYLFRKNFVIDVISNDGNFVLTINNSINNTVFDKEKFLSQLQEQQLRETLNKQFGSLKEAIYKKAFSKVE